MRNEEICKGLLGRLLDIKIDHVEYPELQKVISHFYDSKGVRLDVYVDGGDRMFDIEVQNRLPRNLPKRTCVQLYTRLSKSVREGMHKDIITVV